MTAPADVVGELRPKALAVLREGRCRIVKAESNHLHEVQRVMALVRSSRPEQSAYCVDGADLDSESPRWGCTCRRGMLGEPCAHVAAVMLVTVGVIA